MKTTNFLFIKRLLRLGLLLLAASFFAVPPARAGLTLNFQVSRFSGGYVCYEGLSTNSTPPDSVLGGYVISSPTNAWSETFLFTGAGYPASSYNHITYYPDFNSFFNQITNGNWTILVTNATSTNLYKFTISTTGIDSNSLPVVSIVFPPNGAINVTNNPTFTWQGPSSWGGYLSVEDNNNDYSFYQYAFPPPSQTNWNSPVALPDGYNNFYMYYGADASSSIVASTPTNNLGQPISGWVSSAVLNSSANSYFTVTNLPGGSGGSGSHTLIAYYSFDDGNIGGTDVSGNGNTLGYPFSVGGGSATITNNALAGAYAVAFDNNNGSGLAYYYNSNSNLLSTLKGSFSVSLWLKTTQITGSDTDAGLYGNAGIVSTFNQTVVPMALTGHKLAFVTASASQDTLHSATSINTGQYVHVVVTRDQASGQKKIYINGGLNASDIAETGILHDPRELDIGSGNGTGFKGEMDDIQMYTSVLSSNDVLQLYNHPGTTITNSTTGGGGDLGTALNATNLTWATSGDTSWFVETTNTHDSVSAAQSGIVTNAQMSVLSTTVTGPGTLTFWWETSASDYNYDLEFDMDGSYVDDIYYNQPWIQESAVAIPSGQHTLTWTAFTYGPSDPGDAGFVDQVSFTPQAPINVLQSARFELVLHNDRSIFTPGGGYYAVPFLEALQPQPLTMDEIASPNQKFTVIYTNNSSPSPQSWQVLSTWAELASECTNGLWTLYVNKGDPSERDFKFAVTLNSFNTNTLSPVTVLTPSVGSVNVATNSPIEWTMAGFTNVYILVDLYQTINGFFQDYLYPPDLLPGNATNWIPTSSLNYGTNVVFVITGYPLPFYPTVTPTNATMDVISNWSSSATISASASTTFVVGAPAPLPVQLVSSLPLTSGGNFDLSFQTLAGRPITIQVSTNLSGAWMNVTNFIGDGSVQMFTFPTTNAPGEYFRVMMQ